MNNKESVLHTIIHYIDKHQYPPTIREICNITGLKSTSTVQKYIDQLLQEGKLETDAKLGASRALRVPGYKLVKTKT